MKSFALAIVGGVILFAAPASFGQDRRNAPYEARIEQTLESISPASLPAFRSATQAMDAGQYAEAEPLFRQVVASAPRFTPAMRRLGGVLVELGSDAEGMAMLRQAVQVERSPDNLVSLARSMAYGAGGQPRSRVEREAAFSLAREAANANRDLGDESFDATVVQIALSLQDEPAFRLGVEALALKHPHTAATHYFAAVAAAMDGHWERSEGELREAERLGLPHGVAEAFLASGVHRRAIAWRYARYASYGFALWAVGLLLLFGAGRGLSSRTLASIETADPNELTTPSERYLRRIYRTLIDVAAVYYYVSLPFVIVLVGVATAAAVYACLMVGHVPIKIVAILVAGALITIYKIVQSLFIKVGSDSPGRALEEAEAPALWGVARAVAERVGTRAVDEIRVTPGTEMAVYERGSASERSRDEAARILVLGVGLLNDFRQGAFRAVLAHEYGHFVHRDTAGGDVALRVQRDMMKFAVAMHEQGQAVAWNLGFQFLRIYSFLFRRISHGAARLQEVLADRMAAQAYGPAAFEEGLRHVIQRSAEFEAAVDLEVRRAFYARRAVHNLYALPPVPTADVKYAVEEALARPTTDDDTHPGPAERFRRISGVCYSGTPPDSDAVWKLFADRHRLTDEMTAAVQAQVLEVAAADA